MMEKVYINQRWRKWEKKSQIERDKKERKRERERQRERESAVKKESDRK